VRKTKPLLPAALATLSILSSCTLLASTAAAAPRTRPHSRRVAHATCLAIASRRALARAAVRRDERRSCRQVARHARRAPAPPTSSSATGPVDASAQTAATTRSATIAAVLATPCANVETTPEAGNLGEAREAVLCLINHERAENGELPLKLDADLQAAAEEHSQELIADDYFAHVSPSGVTPVDRDRATGYVPSPSDGYVIGENLAWGTYTLATPQAIVSAWIASPEHLANILEAAYTETGIGIVPAVPASLAEGAPGATYAQEFGVLIP
jgi:uncharacterized protein YkwD